MTSPRLALLSRSFGRIATDRYVLVVLVLGLLLLAIGGATAAFSVAAEWGKGERTSAALRAVAWTQGTAGFDAMMIALAAVLGINLIHQDARRGTLFAVLARPVSRVEVFVMAWTAAALSLLAVEAIRSVPIVATAAWFEGRLDALHVVGVVGIVAGEWLALAAFAALGAVVPPGYALLAGVGFFLLAGAAFTESVGGIAAVIVNGVASAFPLPHHQSRALTEILVGSKRDLATPLEIVGYRLSWAALLVTLGALGFSRRNLAPRV